MDYLDRIHCFPKYHFRAGREVGFWDWGGQKKKFPGRGFFHLKILEDFPMRGFFPPKIHQIYGKFWPQSTIQGWGEAGWGGIINYLSWTFEARHKYWGGHGPPGPPSNSLPASGGTNKVFDQEDVILFWLVRREREKSGYIWGDLSGG